MADLAILDLGLLSDAFEERAPSRRLLRYYLNAGKPLIILGTDKGRRRPYREEGLVLVKSRPAAGPLSTPSGGCSRKRPDRSGFQPAEPLKLLAAGA